jgi:hypothetical protein
MSQKRYNKNLKRKSGKPQLSKEQRREARLRDSIISQSVNQLLSNISSKQSIQK